MAARKHNNYNMLNRRNLFTFCHLPIAETRVRRGAIGRWFLKAGCYCNSRFLSFPSSRPAAVIILYDTFERSFIAGRPFSKNANLLARFFVVILQTSEWRGAAATRWLVFYFIISSFPLVVIFPANQFSRGLCKFPPWLLARALPLRCSAQRGGARDWLRVSQRADV